MAQELSVPLFLRRLLISAMEIRDQRDVTDPTDILFPSRVHGGAVLDMRKRTRKAGELRHVAMDAKSIPTRRGSLTVERVEPFWIKVFDTVEASDIALFSRGIQMAALGVDDPGLTNDIDARADDIASDLLDDIRTQRRILCRQALRDGLSFRMAGKAADDTTSLSLTTLTAPSACDVAVTWDTVATADPVSNLLQWIEEFQNNNDKGLPPQVAFYNPSIFRRYIWPNTNLQTYIQNAPDLSKGHIFVPGGQTFADTLGNLPEWMGLHWVPFHGTENDLADAAQNKWPTTSLTLARVDDINGARPEWGMTNDPMYTKNSGNWVIEVEEVNSDGVKAFKVHAYYQGAPLFADNQMVQRVADLTA